jgi:peptide-methionine (S)-S-oxide reductase
MLLTRRKTELPDRESALPGRQVPIEITRPHLVLGTSLTPPFERAL